MFLVISNIGLNTLHNIYIKYSWEINQLYCTVNVSLEQALGKKEKIFEKICVSNWDYKLPHSSSV